MTGLFAGRRLGPGLVSILALAGLLASAASAQSPPASPASSTEKPGKEETAPKQDAGGLILSFSSRGRYETVAGRPTPGHPSSEDAFLLRTGVALEYGPGALAIGGELIDSRAYGLARTTSIGRDDVDAVELPQAYLKLRLHDMFGAGSELGLEGGRFLLNLGSGRLLATDEYRNTVNGFTGLRVDLKRDRRTDLTLLYVLPQERLPDELAAIRRNRVRFDRETFDDVLFGAHLARKHVLAGGTGEIALYRFAEHSSPGRATADRRLVYADVRLARDARPASWDFDVEGVYEWGRARSSTSATMPRRDVSAGLLHASAGYTWRTALTPRLGLFYDYASGDGRGDRFGRFDTLFGSRRDDLGPSGLYSGLARENISAPGVRLELKPGKRIETLTTYRAIWLASRFDRFYGVTDATGASGNFGGHQLEGRARLWLVPDHLRLESNFALLFKGRFLREAPQAIARDRMVVRYWEINLQATL